MLNHGSFGACPLAVLVFQQTLRRQMEREPVRFLTREMTPLLDESRQTLAARIGADPANLVFVRNATSAVNSVLRSLEFAPGDEILVTNHGYNACRNVVDYIAGRSNARVVTAEIPFPLHSPEEILQPVLAAVTERTRLAVLDHITSPTAVVFPIVELVRELKERGVETLVDGAHAPGMVPLDLERWGAAYYTGNCHKWLCAPKGSAFLHVRPDRQQEIQPAVISHGYNTRRPGRNRLHDAFDWTGTDDPTPWLCVGRAIRFLDDLGRQSDAAQNGPGMETLMGQNHRMAVSARQLLSSAMGIELPCPEEMIGAMGAIPISADPDPGAIRPETATSPVQRLQEALVDRFAVEAPLYYWPAPPCRLVRVCAAPYNRMEEYARLADALAVLLRDRA